MKTMQREVRSLQREITAIKRDITLAEQHALTDLQDLMSRHSQAKARKTMARLEHLFEQVGNDTQEMDRIAQDLREEPYLQADAITEYYQAQQAWRLQKARTQGAARQGW